jgi:hypothetical protein
MHGAILDVSGNFFPILSIKEKAVVEALVVLISPIKQRFALEVIKFFF